MFATEIDGGHPGDGAWLSLTEMETLQVLVLPERSVTVYLTFETPGFKVVPLAFPVPVPLVAPVRFQVV